MTEKIEWSDSYLLGIPEIDGQHKKLLAVANGLYEAASGSAERYKLDMSKNLKKLTDYTEYHFSSEEEFMRSYGYSGADEHKKFHDAFIAEVNSQIQKLSADNREDGAQFYKYVADWVLTHIAQADKVWAAFVKPRM